ncbi:nitrite reductase [Paenibacillus radicis (ex Xue et al. 2023)]|uniref:Nitrite reductase n=1 Tax=Paenibacillus radicis (ex Xue et al. 2023) TaxID=2972489 RepID=A0ABT1YI44_9BACL|nr:nitrite reductase [Paenibacillus radicis (ex Xue et al. 2023)]MCR8632099.1 nitrite reductase [Paenibacillus radicis (ex Xue et al. 2023)]
MGEKIKIAVSPPIQVGGSLFTAEQLAAIGTLAGPGSKIEMTSFKQMYVEVDTDRVEDVKNNLQKIGLEIYSAGFSVKSLIACNFCRGAEEAGLEMAHILNKAVAGIETPIPIKVGYAGCALGTSEPMLKDIGVVKMKETFDVYVGGEPKSLKASVGKLLLSGIAQEQLVQSVTNIISFYKENAKGKEKFSKFVDRVTLEVLKQIAA